MPPPENAPRAEAAHPADHEPVELTADVDWTPVGGRLPHTIAAARTVRVTVHAGWRAANGTTYLLLDIDGGHTMYARRPQHADFAWSYQAAGIADRAQLLAPGATGRIGNFRLTRMTAAEVTALSPIAVTRISR